MLNYSAQLTEENTEYVGLISRAYGISSSDVINAALDEKRKNDAGTLKKIKEFMGKLWNPGKEETPIPVPDEDPGVILVPTEKKKRKGKMCREEFVDYFSEKQKQAPF